MGTRIKKGASSRKCIAAASSEVKLRYSVQVSGVALLRPWNRTTRQEKDEGSGMPMSRNSEQKREGIAWEGGKKRDLRCRSVGPGPQEERKPASTRHATHGD